MIPVARAGVPGTLVVTVSTVLFGGLVQACDSAPPEPEGPITADTYVEVMAELSDLKRYPPSGPDYTTRTARADSVRQVILDRHGVTAEELLAYAELMGADPARMLELTERITTIVDSLAELRVAPPADSSRARRDSAVIPPVPDSSPTSVRRMRERLGLPLRPEPKPTVDTVPTAADSTTP